MPDARGQCEECNVAVLLASQGSSVHRRGVRVEPTQIPSCAFLADDLESATAGASDLLAGRLRDITDDPIEILLRAASPIAPEDLVSGRMVRLEVEIN